MRRLSAHIMKILTQEERKSLGWLLLSDVIIGVADIGFLALLLLIVQSPTRFGQHFTATIVAFFLLFAGKNAGGFLVYRAQCKFIFRVAGRLSRDKLSQYQEGSYAAFAGIDSSVHIRDVSYSPLEFCQHVLGGFQQMITQAVLILLAIGGIILYNAQLFFLLLAILLPPIIALSYLLRGRLHRVRKDAQRSSERSLQHLQEALAGYVETNIYDRNKVFLDRYLHFQRQYSDSLSGQMILQGAPVRMIEVFALLGVVVLVLVHQWTGAADNNAVLTIGVFMAAAYKIIPGIVKMMNLSGQINAYAFTMDRLVAGEVQNPPVSGGVQRISSLLLEDIRFSFNGSAVLQDVSLRLEKGDLVGIAGPSGQGKTTLLNVMLGFLQPQGGAVRVNEDAVGTRAYWDRIAYVKQQSFLIHDTIRQNITLNGDCDEDRLREAIEGAGLGPLIASMHGVDAMIMENGRNISGGQRQRIVLARALYKEADLIILDEPFNELDEDSERSLLEHLRRLAMQGRIIVLITHHQKSLSFCNKILTLHEK